MNLAERWAGAAASSAGEVALVAGDEGVTFRDLDDRVGALARALRGCGLGSGDLVGVCMPNGVDLVATFLGVWSIGAVVVDLDPSTGEDAARSLAERSGAATLLTEGGFNRGVPRDPPRFGGAVRTDDPSLACINLTSGSTGVPKGVMLPHRNLVRNAELYVRHFGVTPADRTCLVLPLFFGMNKIALLAHLFTGGGVILERGFAVPNQALAAMEAHRATGLCAVPATVRALLARGDVESYPVRSLRYVRIGAGRMDGPAMEALRRTWPAGEVYLTYGLTEVGLVSVLTADEFDERPDSSGRVLPEVAVEVSDEGELVVRADHAAIGYWRDPAATADAFRPDGVHTGDLGRLDGDGYLYLTGREKELIKVAGENVHAAEVEEALRSHPGVSEAAVVGVPDPWLGEAVKAFVVPRPGHRLDLTDLRRHCNRFLPPAKRPKEFEVRSSLPRTPTGKVRRAALAVAGEARGSAGSK